MLTNLGKLLSLLRYRIYIISHFVLSNAMAHAAIDVTDWCFDLYATAHEGEFCHSLWQQRL